jgi:hypothetical protein
MALIAAYHFNCTKFGKKFKARLLQERNVPEFVLLVAIVSPIFFPMYWILVLIVYLIFRYEEKHKINRLR